ncbi:MAG: hypothetical protein EXR27_08880 [Betaproteobacteria bacterium]|nr:hypothetical protein [Betaproteobacteria bacterium]
MTLRTIAGKFAFGLVALAWAGVLSAQALEKVSVRLDWTPWGAHAPIHLAAAKGWFKEAGLEVDVQDGNGSVTTVQLVGSGNFDVGHASLAPMIIAREKGLPVMAIANFARKNDIGLLVPKGSNMRTPKDLIGKKMLFTAGSLEAPFLDTFLAAGGVKREQVEFINVEASAKLSSYIALRADGVFSTVPFVLPAVAAQRASDAVLFADNGLQFPSFGLLSNEDTMKKRGPVLRRFASIVAGAWAYIQAGHQDEGANAIVTQRPQAKLDPKILRAQIDALQAYFNTPASQGQPIGIMMEKDWEIALKTMADAKLVKSGKPAEFYSNAFLDTETIRKISGR